MSKWAMRLRCKKIWSDVSFGSGMRRATTCSLEEGRSGQRDSKHLSYVVGDVSFLLNLTISIVHKEKNYWIKMFKKFMLFLCGQSVFCCCCFRFCYVFFSLCSCEWVFFVGWRCVVIVWAFPCSNARNFCCCCLTIINLGYNFTCDICNPHHRRMIGSSRLDVIRSQTNASEKRNFPFDCVGCFIWSFANWFCYSAHIHTQFSLINPIVLRSH